MYGVDSDRDATGVAICWNWDFPEVAWPEISAIPSPYVVLADEERMWLEHRAPYMPPYW
jgi:hypothetical protein